MSKYFLYKVDGNFEVIHLIENIEENINQKSSDSSLEEIELGITFKVFDTKEELEDYQPYKEHLYSLEENSLKESLHQERKSLRDSEKYAPTIDCLGRTYKSDKESMTALGFSRGGMNDATTNIDWWDNNDVKVSLTLDNVKEIINAVRTRGLEAIQKSKTIKAEINDINDINELKNYDVQTRWNELS
jgi:hypothetical protein